MQLTWIKKVYLYLVSLISLVILVIASIMLINLALKTWVFPKADQDYYSYAAISCPEKVEGTEVYRDPGCDEPGYAERMKREEMERRSAQKQRDASVALAMILVAAPVFYYHWKLARKEA